MRVTVSGCTGGEVVIELLEGKTGAAALGII